VVAKHLKGKKLDSGSVQKYIKELVNGFAFIFGEKDEHVSVIYWTKNFKGSNGWF
jgi:hypothetical protein